MTLLFITQKMHEQDAFSVLWASAFVRAGYDVHVVCLEDRRELAVKMLGDASRIAPLTVHSLGKEKGAGKLRQILRFWKILLTVKHDRVFLHMSPVWGLLGAWYWIPRRLPVYLWYTHYKMQLGLWLFGFYGKRFFCATPQSLPQYEGSPKKIVTGHGIDLAYWPPRANTATDPHRLLIVHRLSRSKRVELILHAMAMLSDAYTLDIYGIEAEPDYVAELRSLVAALGLQRHVTFHGTMPARDLPVLYYSHTLILNMASETIDKTMLEAMTCGCYPVTTARNAETIGLTAAVRAPEEAAPAADTPAAIAAFIERYGTRPPLDAEAMYSIVAEYHSLDALIGKMDRYMREGT